MIKKIMSIVVALVALFFIIALILPSAYTVERSTVIEESPEVVFGQVADFNNWLAWNPWTEVEPTAKNQITGPVAAVGAQWSWEGEGLGTGSITIAEIEPHRHIESKLVFVEPMASEATDTWTFEPAGNGTRVTWRNSGDLDYPMGRYFGLFVEKMLGSQFEKGLSNLKAHCESLEEEPSGQEEAPEQTTSL